MIAEAMGWSYKRVEQGAMVLSEGGADGRDSLNNTHHHPLVIQFHQIESNL